MCRVVGKLDSKFSSDHLFFYSLHNVWDFVINDGENVFVNILSASTSGNPSSDSLVGKTLPIFKLSLSVEISGSIPVLK